MARWVGTGRWVFFLVCDDVRLVWSGRLVVQSGVVCRLEGNFFEKGFEKGFGQCDVLLLRCTGERWD